MKPKLRVNETDLWPRVSTSYVKTVGAAIIHPEHRLFEQLQIFPAGMQPEENVGWYDKAIKIIFPTTRTINKLELNRKSNPNKIVVT